MLKPEKFDVETIEPSGVTGSTIGLCCVAITWQQIFKGSLQVGAVAFCRM